MRHRPHHRRDASAAIRLSRPIRRLLRQRHSPQSGIRLTCAPLLRLLPSWHLFLADRPDPRTAGHGRVVHPAALITTMVPLTPVGRLCRRDSAAGSQQFRHQAPLTGLVQSLFLLGQKPRPHTPSHAASASQERAGADKQPALVKNHDAAASAAIGVGVGFFYAQVHVGQDHEVTGGLHLAADQSGAAIAA